MITRFKIFESYNLDVNFKVGDYVYCINNDRSSLHFDKIYKIVKIYHIWSNNEIQESNNPEDMCDVLDFEEAKKYPNDNNIYTAFYLKRFISEDEYEVWQNMKKYNL